ncbi:MAG: ABC transporter substrate-binding protein [Oscillospiraceae bacterium]|nr:ABC transporter substrate-binding protein [Oscillospiraceae bacterium]
MKKTLAILLALALALGIFAGCSSTTQPESETGGESSGGAGVLRAMWTAQKGTDTIFESPAVDRQCLYPHMVFDRLISYEADGSVGYRLATDMTVSEDGLTYTFTLRDDALWQDGEAFDAGDVAFTLWAYLADPYGSYKSGLSYIEGASEVMENGAESLSGVSAEDGVVTITLTSPYSLFVSDIAFTYILPEHLLGEVAAEELSTNEDYWKKPIGLGQYMIDEVSFPDYCTLVAYEGYYGAQPGIAEVLLTSYATGGSDAVTNALTAGELDFAYGNEVNDITVAETIASMNSDIAILESTSNYQRQFLFNFVESADGQLHPDLAIREVRQAINMLIDKQAIAELFGSNAAALTTHLNPDSPMYDSSLPAFERDVEGAKALLDAAGFDYNHEIRIAYYYTNQTTIDAMDLVVQNLADAGITASASLLSGDLGTLIYVDRNYDMLFCGEAADDPAQMYFYLLGVGGYFDDIVGDLETRRTLFNDVIDQYYATTDSAEQYELACLLQSNGYDFCGISPVVAIKTLQLYNAANLSVPAGVFEVDWRTRDWRFEDWSLTA